MSPRWPSVILIAVDEQERALLTQLCDQLPALRAEAGHSPSAARLLALIEANARAHQPFLDLLAELLNADPTAVSRQFGALPGIGQGRANVERFGCPDGSCDRMAGTVPAGPIPVCPLTGRAMVRR